MRTLITLCGHTARNGSIGALLDALDKCRTAVISEARAQGLPREREANAQLAADLFTGAARRFV